VSGLPESGQPALWQFDRQSGAHVRREDADLCRPAVSHTDGTIAYCQQGAIVVRDADGGGDRVLAANATDPDFSPSGERLAYVDRSTGRDVIWTVGVDGSDRRQLMAHTTDARFPTWSPDGAQIAFVSGSSLSRSVWIVAADGSGAREVSVRFNGLDAHPLDWSPDGRLLAFTCLPSPTSRPASEVAEAAQETGVCFLDVATGEWHAVTPGWLQATSPSWSPDGSEIAFTAHPGTNTATSEVWVMRGDGTEERRLWPGDTFENPAWYPVYLRARPSTTN
jgi:Tol biopolymer transport system component